MTYEDLGKGVVKRTERREVGIFIDGVGLDRATRRLNRKVDMSALVKGVTSGLTTRTARYYTLIPYEDDSRQRAFLDAVGRGGLSVFVKRLPPKGVNRQVSIETEMAADIIAFAFGYSNFQDMNQELSSSDAASEFTGRANAHGYSPTQSVIPRNGLATRHRRVAPRDGGNESEGGESSSLHLQAERSAVSPSPVDSAPLVEPSNSPLPERTAVKRVVTVVCPGRDLGYPISMIRSLGVDTVTADFGQFMTGDILKSAAKWIDLSSSETIWRE